MRSRVISQKAAVSVVYAGAMFIAVMDQTIVNVALAAIGREFHTQPTAVAGAVIGYQVSVALFIPAAVVGWVWNSRPIAARATLTIVWSITAMNMAPA